MTIVVDANIILSGIINPYSVISILLIGENSAIEFIMPEFALTEINHHKERICKKSKVPPAVFDKLLEKFLENITVFGHDSITTETYKEAEQLTALIDTNDTWYVAFAIAFKGLLWTGDLKLYKALRKQKFYQILITAEFLSLHKGF